jgi:hypothetical protein
MLQIVSQTNLDTVIFMSDDTPMYQVVGLNLGLLKKKFLCIGTEGLNRSSKLIDGKYYDGLQARFTKSNSTSYNRYSANRTFFKRVVKDDEKHETMHLTIANMYRHLDNISIQMKLNTPMKADQGVISQVEKLSSHVKISERLQNLCDINLSSNIPLINKNIKTSEEEEELKNTMDLAVYKTKVFEENYRAMYPLLVLKNFSGESGEHHTTFSEFERFNKYSNMIKDVEKPSEDARRKFIELCEIFRLNKVIKNIKVNNFEVIQQDDYLKIRLFGITIAITTNLKHFLYFDHPGINFVADFIDKNDMLNNIEAKISKEIFTRI